MEPTQIDLLLTNATVITMNPDGQIIMDGAVAVHRDSIVEVAPTAQLVEKYEAAKVIDCSDCIISPGLINTHTHVPMTLLRGLSDDLRLDVWLYGFIMPVEREFVNPEFTSIGTQLACAEMIRSGITTFCEMYYFEDYIAQAAAKAGMRAVCSQTILKFPAPDAASYDESLDYCRSFIQKWKGHPLIVPAIAPHAPYTATPDMLRACAEIATNHDVPLHIHIAETALEQQASREAFDMPVVPWLKQYGVFEAKVIAAHCVHLDEMEMTILKAANAGVAHCPSANLKLASGVAPIYKMLDMGINVGIGTDGPASNNDLDLVEETRLTAFLQKGTFTNPVLLPAKTAWEMATIGGARAIHLSHLTGSLEANKRADITVFDMTGSHQTPRFSHNADAVYSQLVYSAKATDVKHVIVNGQILMEDRKLYTVNEADLHQKAIELSTKIDTFISSREEDLMSKLLAVSSGVIPIETYEVQVKVKIDNIAKIEEALKQDEIKINRSSVRKQYDIYFSFDQEGLGRIRHREDEVLGQDDLPKEIFYRITLIGPTIERAFDNTILLTRSRYSVKADKSPRFYREYFNASEEILVEKRRKRYHLTYKDTQFALNLDALFDGRGTYLEIKSRTWSARDAEYKATLIKELLQLLGTQTEDQVFKEYIDLV